tara:strand:- start:627 stop:3191 length:2565 start_codon:yes stop_codon:yes gene_type:complete
MHKGIRSSNSDPDTKARADTKKPIVGNYLGIVIQNNDPAKRGRVKVWVPHINATVYDNWDKIPKDKKFKFLGRNVDSDLNDILEELKLLLPWADTVAPIMGASGSGRYNANLEVGTISDSAQVRTITPNDDNDKKYILNTDNIGEKPARVYEVDDLKVHDAFNVSNRTDQGSASGRGMPNKVNKFSYSYIPKSHSNEAKGSFSIPNVGSHVWVFFNGGDHNSPIVFGASYGHEDWKGIYESQDDETGPDYPGAYENRSAAEDSRYDHNTETYRNKYVLNQKGGTMEIVNTDNREILKLTHYSGSFKEFNNHITKEFATGNDDKYVLGDQFTTIGGHRNEFSDGDYDLITRGDQYNKIGNHTVKEFIEWKTLVRKIADVKQLFDVKRASFDKSRNIYYQKTAPSQEQAGVPAPCPLCSASGREPYWDVTQDPIQQIIAPVFSTVLGTTLGGKVAKLGMKFFASYIQPFGPQPAFNYVQAPSNPFNFLGGGPCPVCKGTGLSPASEGGEWLQQGTDATGLPILDSSGVPVGKDGAVKAQIDEVIQDLTRIEKKLGLGGSQIIDITKHKVETIGLVMNDFPCIRIDEEGVCAKNEITIFKKGVTSTFATAPIIEQVHVDGLPGGDYTLNVMNKFNCQVGAGGISMKTLGHVELGGSIVNIAGEQVNVASDNEINIVAKRITMVADILTLRDKKYKQVVVDSSLGVAYNVVIGGGLHVEGELTCQHITGPSQLNQTENISVPAKALAALQVGQIQGIAYGVTADGMAVTINNWVTAPVMGSGLPDTIEVAPHQHGYKTVGMTMLPNSDGVRTVGQACLLPQKVGPQPVENEDLSDIIGDILDEIPLPDIDIGGDTEIA